MGEDVSLSDAAVVTELRLIALAFRMGGTVSGADRLLTSSTLTHSPQGALLAVPCGQDGREGAE